MPIDINSDPATQAAKLLVEKINAHDFGVEFKAERSYGDFDLQLEDADCLHVDVVLFDCRPSLDTRHDTGFLVDLQIAIRKRFSQSDQSAMTGRIQVAELDRLNGLTLAMHEFLCSESQRELADNIHWRETAIQLPYDREHLRAMRQWTSILRVRLAISEPQEDDE